MVTATVLCSRNFPQLGTSSPMPSIRGSITTTRTTLSRSRSMASAVTMWATIATFPIQPTPLIPLMPRRVTVPMVRLRQSTRCRFPRASMRSSSRAPMIARSMASSIDMRQALSSRRHFRCCVHGHSRMSVSMSISMTSALTAIVKRMVLPTMA